jgi:GTP-binding protein EngB required for normal cell division
VSIAGRLRDAMRRDSPRVDADRLLKRIDALDRFIKAAEAHVPADDLRPARAVVERAGGRLALSRDHTVVALAGATGSGKSSLFNALSGMSLSTVGVRRPTTGVAHACLWNPDGSAGLLDWLGIPPDRRYTRSTAGDPQPELAGLVLLDLPDFDSIQAAHRLEVDRLLRLVDLVVWVTDPQKYADQVIHEQYLRTFHRHVDSTVVVLNQADRLSEVDARRCLTDLSGLLNRDGFASIPVFAVSATSDRPGIGELQEMLQAAVSERMAALNRLSADVDGAAAESGRLVGPAVSREMLDRVSADAVADALAGSAGVPAVTEATEAAYRYRARASMGWPFVRWVRRMKTDPLRRLRLGAVNIGTDASSIPAAQPAQRSAADLAVRTLSDRAGQGLPVPWPGAVTVAARSNLATLPDELDRAIVQTDLGMDRKRWWWRIIGFLQWMLTIVAVLGGLWLLVRIGLIALGVATVSLPSTDVRHVGDVPWATIALIGGAIAGILIALLVKPLIGLGAQRSRRRAAIRLHASVTAVAQDQVVDPVRAVLADYTTARDALTEAAK